MKRPYFRFCGEFWWLLQDLDDADQLTMLRQLITYGLTGEESQTLSPVLQVIWISIKRELSINNKKYLGAIRGGNPRFIKGQTNPYYNKVDNHADNHIDNHADNHADNHIDNHADNHADNHVFTDYQEVSAKDCEFGGVLKENEEKKEEKRTKKEVSKEVKEKNI